MSEANTEHFVSTPSPEIISIYDADGKKKSPATLLIELAQQVELFHDADGTGYAVIEENYHSEVWALRSKGFKDWIGKRFYEEFDKGANNPAGKTDF